MKDKGVKDKTHFILPTINNIQNHPSPSPMDPSPTLSSS